MNFLQNWLEDLGVDTEMTTYLANTIMITAIILLSIVANFITKKVVLKILSFYIKNNRYKWDDYMLEHKVIHRLSHVVPAIIIYFSAFLFPDYQELIKTGVGIYIIIVALMIINSFLNAVDDIYRTYEISKARPIRGYLQVAKIFIFTIGGILLVSNMIGESPIILLSGIGALSAVILLIFKDSILGLVAGVQLTSNDMVRVGDWIEMPKYNADGDIIDISLNTVKVQNWDKTITTIPTYALISDSFKNWRGMQNSGGRRIMRAVSIDTGSITICSPDMIERFKKIQLLEEYLTSRTVEIEKFNAENQFDLSNKVNGRALTNIGIFRVYIESYIKHHPKIHKGMTCMVRQLQSAENGVPIEIYAFTNTVDWGIYEDVQADIFDHILAVAPEFGLRVFQNPTGHDLNSALQTERTQKVLSS